MFEIIYYISDSVLRGEIEYFPTIVCMLIFQPGGREVISKNAGIILVKLAYKIPNSSQLLKAVLWNWTVPKVRTHKAGAFKSKEGYSKPELAN